MMPVTPFPGIGFAPILMWLVVPLLVLWIVRRQIGKSCCWRQQHGPK